jgi:hypothetical protein
MTEALEALGPSHALAKVTGHLIRAEYELEKAGVAASQDDADKPLAVSLELVREALSLLPTLRAALSAEPVDDRIGKWLSAALEDSSTCAEMKADIEAWFAARAERES